MQNMLKRLLSLAIAMAMVLVMLPAGILQVDAAASSSDINMYYDDRMALTELRGNAESAVEITNQTVTSKKVGSAEADAAVLVRQGGELIAVGTGSATVTVDGTAYSVKVTAAPISLLMITGHSIGAGQTGNAEQSVLCDAGQVYSTHGTELASASTTGVGIGYGATTRPNGIDALSGGGVLGEAGGIAYRWNQLTGEKIWVLNTAVGGTGLIKWVKGTPCYNNSVNVFRYAQNVLKNEITAGHYQLKNQVLINHSCANWGWSDNGNWSDAEGAGWYASMLDGFKADIPMDVDGDGVVDPLDGIGLVPIFTTDLAKKYSNDTGANFFMAASASYPNVFMASLATRTWVNDISKFPDITYTTQGTAVSKPTTVAQLFASDGVHLSQVTYNAAGMDIAENVYKYLRGDNTATSMSFKTTSAASVGDEIVMAVGDTIRLVPEVSPITASNLTFTLSKNLSMTYPCTVKADADGLGTLIVSQNGATVARLTFAVGDTSVPVEPTFPEGWSVTYHCVCGNPASINNPCADAGHKPVEWKPWTITNTVPFLEGYWYLPNNLDLTSATDYKYFNGFGTTTGVIGRNATVAAEADSLVTKAVHVYVDLNGKTVTGKSYHKIYRLEPGYGHSLTICDTVGGGKLVAKSPATNENVGMAIWTRGTENQVTIYGGTLDASGATVYKSGGYAQGGAIKNAGTMKIYGGKVIGATVNAVTSGSSTGFAQGGAIYNNGKLYIYGGVIQGGTASGATVQGGNIRNEGTLEIHGGSIVGGTANGSNAQGGNVSNVGTLKIYGGTISGGTATDSNGGQGGCLFTTTGATMEGGKIVGGICTRSGTSGTDYLGGCVYIYNGTFLLKKGTIQAYRDGTAAYRGAAVYANGGSDCNAVFTMTGGTVASGKVTDYGGAIGTHGKGTINIQGGTVTAAFYADGTPVTDPADAMAEGLTRVSHAGAAIGTWGGTVNMTAGTIISGDGGGAGGAAVGVHGGTKFNMSGGSIVGGTCSRDNTSLYGGIISIFSSGSMFTMSGGSITGAKANPGAVYVRNGGGMTVSGNAVITGNKDNTGAERNVVLSNKGENGTTTHSVLTVGTGGMGANAKIGITMAVPGTFTTSAANAAAFVADSGYQITTNTEGKLVLSTHSGENHCVCGGTYAGCDHAAIQGEWKAWDGKSSIAEGGNYYLTQSLTGSDQRWMGGTYTNTTKMTINLCLNGHSIDSNYRALAVAPNVTFNLMNCNAVESTLSGCCSSGDNGRVMHVHATTSVVNLYGNIKLQGNNRADRVVACGGVVNNYGQFNMYGGTLVGTWVGGLTAKTENGTTTYAVLPGKGAVINIGDRGVFNLHGGTIYGGNGGLNGESMVIDGANGKYNARSLGGVAVVADSGAFNIHGGTVYGGNVGDGGVVYASGSNAKVTMDGGTVYAGNAAFAGGFAKLEAGATFTMSGGVIDGINPQRPRDIRNAGAAGGGAILLWDAHAVIKGNAVIRNCITSNYGGAVKVATKNSSLTLGGSVQLVNNGKGDINDNTPDDVYLATDVKAKLDGLTTNAKVGIKMQEPGVFTSQGASEALIPAFQSNHSDLMIKYKADGLFLGGLPVVIGGKAYASLTTAIADAKTGDLIKLNESITENVSVDVAVNLDLNGCNVNGNISIANGVELKIFDTATADYTADNRGKITGEITGNLARTMNTPKETFGRNLKYLTIREADGSYSFHRIYLAVESCVLVPAMSGDGYTGAALNYKTVFKCNDVVSQYISGYGAKLSADNTVYVDYLESGDKLLTGAENSNEKKTWLAGALRSSCSEDENNTNAQIAPVVNAFITVNDGKAQNEEITSTSVTRSMKSAIAYANDLYGMTDAQKTALGVLYQRFGNVLDSWTDLNLDHIRSYYKYYIQGDKTPDKAIALTFDDGPNVNNSMSDVMDILEGYDVKATFFLIGSLITDETAPVVKAAYDAGHELGNHSNIHDYLNKMTADEVLADFQACQNSVKNITGEEPKYFRPPFLTTSQTMYDTIDLPFIGGKTVGDYNSGVTAKDIYTTVLDYAYDGAIILMHVSKGYDWTEQSLHTIIPDLRSWGYDIVTLSELFEHTGVDPTQNDILYKDALGN